MNIWSKPDGYVLKSSAGEVAIRIRGDAFAEETQTVEFGGRLYGNTEERDESGFQIYEEDFLIVRYQSRS